VARRAGKEVLDATTARRCFSEVFDRAIHDGVPVPIERGGKERVFLIGEEEVKQLVSEREFHPEVMFEGEGVSIWLPEFAIYGIGESYQEAKDDLLDEVRGYVADYLSTPALRRAVNRQHHYPYVLRVLVADAAESLEEVLFAEPSAVPAASTSPA
jgi:hypothetical protein